MISCDRVASLRRLGLSALIFAALTYGSGLIAVASDRNPAIWPLNAVLLAIMVRVGARRQVVYLFTYACVLAVALTYFGESFVRASCLIFANALELVVTAAVLRRRHVWDLTRLRNERLVALAWWACLFAPAVGATIAASLLSVASGHDFFADWQRWFFADSLGMLVVAPLVILVTREELRGLICASRVSDTLATLGLLAVLDVAIFSQNRYPLLFVAFPILVLAAFRLHFPGAVLATIVTAVIACVGTVAGHGPITLVHGASMTEHVRFLQGYLALAVLMTLPVGAVLGERERMRFQREEQLRLAAANQRDLEDQRAALIMMAEAAQAATRAKSEFLATLSHELRTPMTGVLGMVELLRDEPEGPERVQMLDTLQRSTRSLLGVIGDVLDFSKIEAGKLVIESIDASVRELVASVIDLFSNAASAKNVLLSATFHGAEFPDRMYMDPHRMRQILSNLVGNALKFTSSGTIEIAVDVTPLEDGAFRGRFSVIDTGIGIDPEAREHLFTAFTQADASTTRRFGGTGLGLTISKRLAEAMGGEIGVESDAGAGSTFWFTVPMLAAVQHRPGDEARTADPFARSDLPLRVLLAEDNRTNQMLVRKMLERMGHEVTCVENGRLAVDAVAARPFDVVLMDMHMPEMDGPAATRAIRVLPGTVSGIPIVALTADAVAEHRELFEDAGLTAFLGKPIDPSGLRRALDDVGAALVGEVRA